MCDDWLQSATALSRSPICENRAQLITNWPARFISWSSRSVSTRTVSVGVGLPVAERLAALARLRGEAGRSGLGRAAGAAPAVRQPGGAVRSAAAGSRQRQRLDARPEHAADATCAATASGGLVGRHVGSGNSPNARLRRAVRRRMEVADLAQLGELLVDQLRFEPGRGKLGLEDDLAATASRPAVGRSRRLRSSPAALAARLLDRASGISSPGSEQSRARAELLGSVVPRAGRPHTGAGHRCT